MFCRVFFFFKQKTAYEMRISDWSSDVCSSDLGARVVITPTSVAPEDPRSYYSVARRIVEETPNSILANQYHNPANPLAHYQTTGPEIWQQTAGQIDRKRVV